MNADPLLQDCGVGTYSASVASFLASMSSGKKLITDPSFNTNCPPIGTINCEFYWWPWSGCRADKTQIMRYTISKYPSKDGTACQYPDGYEHVVSCAGNKWTPIWPDTCNGNTNCQQL